MISVLVPAMVLVSLWRPFNDGVIVLVPFIVADIPVCDEIVALRVDVPAIVVVSR